MNILGIQDVTWQYAEKSVSNAEFAKNHGFDEVFIREKIGISKRYVAVDSEATSDLAIAATKKLIKKNQLDTAEIGILIVVTQTPDYQLPHTAALAQNQLGLRTDIPTFDISLGCSGFVYGLSVAISFMESNNIDTGVLVTVDTYSKIIDSEDRATSPIFSDAASATLISNNPVYIPGRGTYHTDGSGAEELIVKDGGSRNPGKQGSLFMNGRQIYNFMMKNVPGDVDQCLTKNNLVMNDVDKCIFHQANKFMLDSLAKRMGLSEGKLVYNVNDGGNTVSSTIPIALSKIMNEKHKVLLISGFGVGLSWATNVLKLNQEKR